MRSRKVKMAAKKAQRGMCRPTTRSKRALGAPMSAITWEKIEAKMMISMTIDVVRTVAWKASLSARHVSVRATPARSRLTSEPRAAASVGVTMPTYMEPRTTITSRATGATPLHLGNGDHPDGRGGGHARARDGREDGAREDA